MMFASCGSLKFQTAIFGEPRGRGKRMAAEVPGGAKPWMWAPFSPLSGGTVMTTLTDSVLATVSMVKVPVASAGELFGGVSLAPSIGAAMNWIMVALADAAQSHSRPAPITLAQRCSLVMAS